MKKLSLLFIIVFTFIVSGHILAQETECKVLLEPISGQYIGDCKSGLAHGEGVAKGTDIYSGTFKKGLPHGEGIYTFADGGIYVGSFKEGKKSGLGKLKLADGTVVKEGVWKDDEFDREQEVPDYKIILKRNVLNVTIRDLGGEENKVDIILIRDGRESTTNVHDLMVTANSGVQYTDNHSIVYKDILYPFRANVKFKAAGKFSSTTVTGMGADEKMTTQITQLPESAIEFEIVEKGNWEVRIKY